MKKFVNEFIDIWKNKIISVYFQDAPSFNLSLLPKAQVWATYQISGHGAAIINNFGKGKVGAYYRHE